MDYYPKNVVITIARYRTTSSKVASKASRALRSSSSSKTVKSIAGSALLQRQLNHSHKRK